MRQTSKQTGDKEGEYEDKQIRRRVGIQPGKQVVDPKKAGQEASWQTSEQERKEAGRWEQTH